MNLLPIGLIVLSVTSTAFAADLFKDGKPVEYTVDAPLESSTTIGGYPVFKGDGGWQYKEVRSSMSGTTGNAESINRGTAIFSQVEPNGNWFASMAVSANLSSTGANQYMLGSPCGGTHSIAVNKGHGVNDNCLTVDALSFQAGTAMNTYFSVRITQSASAGRSYFMDLRLSAEMLGFRQTAPGDWTEEAIKTVPARKAFMVRLQKWAEQLQDASHKALDFNKPGDVFDGIPSYRTLLTVPSDLADGSYSQQFIGAVESIKNSKPFHAIAYTKTGVQKVKWATENERESQADADKRALELCNTGRPSSAAPCKLYDLTDRNAPAR